MKEGKSNDLIFPPSQSDGTQALPFARPRSWPIFPARVARGGVAAARSTGREINGSAICFEWACSTPARTETVSKDKKG